MSDEIEIRETVMSATEEYPDGSYLRTVAGEVEIATGYYATLYPGKPSPYWHGGPPFFLFNCGSGEMGTLWWSKS
jgi:hypothetical protein